MKNFKKNILSILTIISISVFCCNLSLAYDDRDDILDIATSKVQLAKIMVGTDLGFEGSKNLTRAEATAIVTRLRGIDESIVKKHSDVKSYSDVDLNHWANGYINVASGMGIIKGYDDGSFRPDKEVSIAEFTTMMVRVIGAGNFVETKSMWPNNYMDFANRENLTLGISKMNALPSSRSDAAIIISNSVESPMWESEKIGSVIEGDYIKNEKRTLLLETFKILNFKNVEILEVSEKSNKIKFKNTKNNLIYEYYVDRRIDLYDILEGKTYDIWFDTNINVVTGIFGNYESDMEDGMIKFSRIYDIDLDDHEIDLIIDDEKETYYFDKGLITRVYLNGEAMRVVDLSEMDIDEDKTFGKILLEGNTIKNMYAECFTDMGMVSSIKNDTIYFDNYDIKGIKSSNKAERIDLDDDYEFLVFKNDREIKACDIKKDDILYYFKNKEDKKYTISIYDESVDGCVTSKGSNYIRIDSRRYETDLSYYPSVGDEIIAYMSPKGTIVMYEKLEGSKGSGVNDDDGDDDEEDEDFRLSEDLGIVSSLRTATDEYGEKGIEIEITSADGEKLGNKKIHLTKSFERMYKDKTETNASTMICEILGTDLVKSQYKNSVLEITDLATILRSSILGEIVRYDEYSDYYVIEEFLGISNKDSINIGIDSEDEIKYIDGSYNCIANKYDDYRISNSTEIFVVCDGDEAYEKEIIKVKRDDIDSNIVNVFLAKGDASSGYASILVFEEDVPRTTRDDYGVIVGKEEISTDLSDEAIVLMLLDGDEETYDVNKNVDVPEIGTIIRYGINDDIVIKIDTIDYSSSSEILKDGEKAEKLEGYIIHNNSDTIKVYARRYGSSNDFKDMVIDKADDLLYVKEDKNGNIVESSLSEIKEIASDLILTGKETKVTMHLLEKFNDNDDYSIICINFKEE